MFIELVQGFIGYAEFDDFDSMRGDETSVRGAAAG